MELFKFKKAQVMAVAGIAFLACTGFGLGGFGNDLKSTKSKTVAGIEAKIPYLEYAKYYGYVDSSVKPDGLHKKKDAFYLYVWVPAALDEIGISMVSPAKGKPKKKKDFQHSQYKAGMKKDKKAYFDTFLLLDRMSVIDPKKIKDGGKVLKTLQSNDDNSELPANPSGSNYNSLVRHVSDPANPTQSLVRGLYRITFTSFRGKVAGSYLANVGTNIPGVKIASSLEELHEIVNK